MRGKKTPNFVIFSGNVFHKTRCNSTKQRDIANTKKACKDSATATKFDGVPREKLTEFEQGI